MTTRESNQRRLQSLVGLGISPQSIAKISGKSRSYIARIINGDSSLGSDDFYESLERNLPAIVAARKKCWFSHEGIAADLLTESLAVE